MPELSRRVQAFTDSVIRRMTRINDMTPGSINLSQGFPDFDPPKEILEALKVAAEPWPSPVFDHIRSEKFPRCSGRHVYKEMESSDRSG